MFPDPQLVETNGIRMAIYEQGQGAPVLLLHGFPKLAFSWRYQLPALAAAGFRTIAPDLRGYGNTDKPARIDAYSMQTLIDDVTGLLDALDIDDACFIAHDWGAILAWRMALVVPERMRGLELHMLDACGHWSQQERSEAVNTLIIDWLWRQDDTARQ